MIDRNTITAVGMLFVGALIGYLLITNMPKGVEETKNEPVGEEAQAFAKVERFIWELDDVHPDNINLKSAEKADWPNSCLGLTQYGEMCPEVITPGWRFTLDADGLFMVFHTNKTGTSIRRDMAAEKANQ